MNKVSNQALTRKVFEIFLDNHSGDRQLIALPGGTTAAYLYPAITRSISEGLNYCFLMTDERDVPVGSEHSNYGNYFRGVVGFDSSVSFDIKQKDTRILLMGSKVDYIFVGFGLDGHFASIFNQDNYFDCSSPLICTNKEENGRRLSLSVGFMSQAKKIFVVYSGRRKREILKENNNKYLVNRLINDMKDKIEIITNE